jgi:predicted outer membrane repeat protein
VANNSAQIGGGIAMDGSLTMTNCTVTGNSNTGANTSGGGLSTLKSAVIQSCTIAFNHADTQGGGIYRSGGTVTIGDTIISDNTASTAPNVLGTVSSQGYNLINNASGSTGFGAIGDQVGVLTAFLGSLQDNGGPTLTLEPLLGSPAIDQGKTSLTSDQRGFSRLVDQSTNNANGGDGSDTGAVEVGHVQAGPGFVVNTLAAGEGNCTQEFCTLPAAVGAANQLFGATTKTITFVPSLAGTIVLNSNLNVKQPMAITGPNNGNPLRFDGTSGISISGATKYRIDLSAFSFSGDFTISNLRIFTAPTAILSFSHKITATNCWFDFNVGAEGGAIFNGNEDLILTNCLFTGNQATVSGGGAIENSSVSGPASVTATNCTFTSNNAKTAGGAIWTYATRSVSAATVTLLNCTFTNNSAAPSSGADIAQALTGGTSVVNLANNIFANGTGGSLSSNAPINSQGHNLSTDAASGDAGKGPGGFLAGPGDIRNTDPKLDPGYNYNGGLLPTIALLAGSPAIDHGDSNLAPPTDARGFARAGAADIGAFEFQYIPTTLANISTRLPVQTGDNVLIGGFIVTGTQPKKVIIRALGPSVPVPGTLADPVLELYSGSTLLESNDNWVDSPNKQAIIDSTIPPGNNLESAIVRTLPANNTGYTAIVRGVNNGTGIGVVEAYDLDRTVDSKLANISTRGLVQTGDNVLIAGTIILGQAPQKVIVRAIGPSLPFPGVLADPTLELRDVNGTLLEANDNWMDSPNKQAIIDSTIPPTNNLESAIVRTLPANGAQYTAIVRGVNNTTGIAVVEVYALN